MSAELISQLVIAAASLVGGYLVKHFGLLENGKSTTPTTPTVTPPPAHSFLSSVEAIALQTLLNMSGGQSPGTVPALPGASSNSPTTSTSSFVPLLLKVLENQLIPALQQSANPVVISPSVSPTPVPVPAPAPVVPTASH